MDAQYYPPYLTNKQKWSLILIIVFGCIAVSLNEFYINSRLKVLNEQLEQLQRENQQLQVEVKTARAVKKMMHAEGSYNQEVYDAIMNQKYIPPEDAAIIARIESRFNPRAKSPAGAKGIMQIMPCHGQYYTFDIKTNVEFGCRYFWEQLNQFGTIERAIWAYNAGPAKVGKELPNDTAVYIKKFKKLKREIDA